jgi:DNA-binding beta-propeller fold protein YncE
VQEEAAGQEARQVQAQGEAAAGLMRPRLTTVLIAAAFILILTAPAQGATGTWDRAWGNDVVTGGSPDFEICTVASTCKIGATATPATGGEMNGPNAVASDQAGNVYVADTGNDRIQKFDSTGNFVMAWGRNVDGANPSTAFEICTVAADCQAGSSGGGRGAVDGPRGIATDGAGVWVSDTGNERIQRFDASGNFVLMWGKDVNQDLAGTGFEQCGVSSTCKAGDSGGLGGELSITQGLAADDAGFVYVSEAGNNRIQKFDGTNGAWAGAWGKNVDGTAPGTGYEICTFANQCKMADSSTGLGGELAGPNGMAADSAGHVYVAEFGGRVDRFDTSGNFQLAWGKGVDGPTAGTGYEICTVAASCLSGQVGSLGGEFANPRDVAADPQGNVYVADQSNDRVQRFDASGSWISAWGKDVVTGAAPGFEICTVIASACKAGDDTTALGGELSSPLGIDADGAGRVFVADAAHHRIQEFAEPEPAGGLPAVTPVATPPQPTLSGPAKCKKKKHKRSASAAKRKCKKKR